MVLKSAELSETSFHELSWPAPLNQDKYCPDTEARDGYINATQPNKLGQLLANKSIFF